MADSPSQRSFGQNNAMANTYTQMPIHVVTAVKYRQALILPHWRDDLHGYIGGILTNQGLRLLQINSMPDHLHVLFEHHPDRKLSDVMRMIKADSSRWINQQGFTRTRFQWQVGYGAFHVSRRHVPRVASYIQNQQRHHAKESFGKEYRRLLTEEAIAFDPQYLFQELQG